ncbi:MAG: protein kinase [Myxococcales bacterium]|nr:protein kinase [Myxococcales bacterium]
MSSSPTPPRLGRYAVTRRLGAGGMAEVFLARLRGAEGVDKDVVVKRILPEFAANAGFRAMFVDEARVALRLNHPNVVQVYGFEADGDALLLVMEHVDGPDLGLLAQQVARLGEKLPAPLVAFIMREVARGLHYAHERPDERGRGLDIVHRDVSPNNILLSNEGAVKIGDFGIARVRNATHAEDGSVKGKYAYMAPEQARGEPVDRRADVWSMGMVLVEMLIGRPLLRGQGSADEVLARARVGDLGDLRGVLAEAPEALREVALRALSVERQARYPTAREMGAALGQFLHGLKLGEGADAVALEQYLGRVFPVRRSLRPGHGSSRPPAMSYAAREAETVGAPSAASVAALTMPGTPDAGAFMTAPAIVMPEIPALRIPRLEGIDSVRERVAVVVLAGRMLSSTNPRWEREFADLASGLALRAEAVLEWSPQGSFVMVVGALRPHVDDAQRAAALALDLLDAARTLSDREEGPATALTPTVSLGLDRGMAACVRDGEGTLQRCEIVDDAQGVATSLARLAKAGEVRLSLGLSRVLRRMYQFREAAPGATPESHGVVLDRPRSRAERDRWAEAQGWALSGREPVLGALRDAVDAVASSRVGQSILLSGEPGIGKSTVLGAFALGLHERDLAPGYAVVRMEASLGSAAQPYSFLARLVRQTLITVEAERGHDRSLVEALEHGVRRWSSTVGGQRAALRALRICLGLERDEDPNANTVSRELALVLRPMLADLCHARTAVILLDNLAVADGLSRALLGDLARRPPTAAVLLVLAVRDDDALVRELHSVTTLSLGPLEADARRRMIAAAFGVDDASDALVNEVSQVAGGHPWTILAMTDLLTERGAVRLESRSVAESTFGAHAGPQVRRVDLASARDTALLPGSLDDVVAARLDVLSAEAIALLRWCALCEDELTTELLDALGGAEGPRVRARLVADGILVSTSGREGRRAAWTFAHPAYRKAVQNTLDPTAMPTMHARLADLLEQSGADAVVTLEAIARHREASGAVRPAARAWVEVSLAPTVSADESFDASDRALSLLDGVNDLEGMGLVARALEGREALARTHGALDQRRSALLSLRRVSVTTRDPRWMGRALVRQARYKFELTTGQGIERDLAAAIRLAGRAQDAVCEGEARVILAQNALRRGELDVAQHGAASALATLSRVEAIESARRARSLEVEALSVKSEVFLRRRRLDEATHRAARAWAIVHSAGLSRLRGTVAATLGRVCFARGDVREALGWFRNGMSAEREFGDREGLGVLLADAGIVEAADGRYAVASNYLQKAESLLLGSTTYRRPLRAEILSVQALIWVHRGELDEAAAAVERARALARLVGAVRELRLVALSDATVALARRQFRAARRAAEEAESSAQSRGVVVDGLRAAALVAEAAALHGDRVAGGEALERVFADRAMQNPTQLPWCEAILGHCLRALRAMHATHEAEQLAALVERLELRAQGREEMTVTE